MNIKSKLFTYTVVMFGSVAARSIFPVHAQQVFSSNVITQGSLCVGTDCANSESFGFDTIILKENNLRIFFNDTSVPGGFPSNDWRIITNDTNNGGNSFFAIEDATAGQTLFRICAVADTSCSPVNPFPGDTINLQNDIQTNANNIQTNTNGIQANANNIQTNTTGIQTNANNIQTNTTGIQTNANNILINTNNIRNIQINSNRILSNTNNINNLGSGVRNMGALTAALNALPNSSSNSGSECGIGTGLYSERIAFALGCAFRPSPRFSINVGASHVFEGEESYGEGRLDNSMFKLGLSLKLGKSFDFKASSNLDLESEIKRQNEIIESQVGQIDVLTQTINEMMDRIAQLEMNSHLVLVD